MLIRTLTYSKKCKNLVLVLKRKKPNKTKQKPNKKNPSLLLPPIQEPDEMKLESDQETNDLHSLAEGKEGRQDLHSDGKVGAFPAARLSLA